MDGGCSQIDHSHRSAGRRKSDNEATNVSSRPEAVTRRKMGQTPAMCVKRPFEWALPWEAAESGGASIVPIDAAPYYVRIRG